MIPEAKLTKLAYEVLTPGKIIPPKYLLFLTRSSVVAVPKSTIIELFYFSLLATLTILLGIYPKILFQMIDQSINIGILS